MGEYPNLAEWGPVRLTPIQPIYRQTHVEETNFIKTTTLKADQI